MAFQEICYSKFVVPRKMEEDFNDWARDYFHLDLSQMAFQSVNHDKAVKRVKFGQATLELIMFSDGSKSAFFNFPSDFDGTFTCVAAQNTWRQP